MPDLIRHPVPREAWIAGRARNDSGGVTSAGCTAGAGQFEDGSIGVVHYLANGSKAFPKERLEVFAAGRVLQLDNFRKLRGFGWPGFNKMNL